MSSVRRVVAQRPSNLYYSDDGPYFYSYTEIVTMAVGEYHAVQNGNQFTFPDEIACADAIYYLNDNAYNGDRYTSGHQTFTDMGKEIKFGVNGGQNDHFTLRLVQLRGLDNYANSNKVGATYNTFWVLVDAKTTTGMKDELEGGDGYGDVYISRA